jgi:hypothetical protein
METSLRRGGPRGRAWRRDGCEEGAPTTRALTPVFDGLRGAPTMAGPPVPNKSPAQFPARAQIASFNFTNTPIRALRQ